MNKIQNWLVRRRFSYDNGQRVANVRIVTACRVAHLNINFVGPTVLTLRHICEKAVIIDAAGLWLSKK